jgi:hypothetical protein
MDDLQEWAREISEECMGSADERGGVYARASQYYYMGSQDSRAAIYNKCKSFVDKLAGFLMQPSDVRFNLLYDTTEPEDVLERSQVCSEKLSADFRQTDADVTFAEAVVWSLVNGCQLLKVRPRGMTFSADPVHPQNFGVLSETITSLDEQEVFCHVSYPTMSRLRSQLQQDNHPRLTEIMARIESARQYERDQSETNYVHQMVVGGLHPLGNVGDQPEAAGITNIFPMPIPWRPQAKFLETVKLCELWVRDREAAHPGDYTTVQLIYPDIIVYPLTPATKDKRNLSRVPDRSPFIKIQPQNTPAYFWGRSMLADVQMLQDLLNKRLRDLKVMWDRNASAPYTLTGFSGVTEDMYFKVINEGGFLADSNPNAKATKMVEPPPQGYMEELEFIWKMFDEASGFSPVMSGQGEPGVRAGVHAQTLVRTSSPRLIDQAARIERQLAEVGYIAFRIMQAQDPSIYTTDKGIDFRLLQMPEGFQIQVDSHSASPAFAEDNRQLAAFLAKLGAVDGEDIVHMVHPPSADLILARMKQRQKAQAQAAQQQKQEDLVRDVIGLPQASRGGGKRRR